MDYVFEPSYAPHCPQAVEQFLPGHLADAQPRHAGGEDLLRDALHRKLALAPDVVEQATEPEPEPAQQAQGQNPPLLARLAAIREQRAVPRWAA